MDYTSEPLRAQTTSVAVRSPAPAGESYPLTGGTAIVFSFLLNAPDHSAPFDELADLLWPHSRPRHWRGLISFYGRWLQERLAAGWAVTVDDDRLCLSAEPGLIDEWLLSNRAVQNLKRRTWRPPTESQNRSLSYESPLDTFRVFTRRPNHRFPTDSASVVGATTLGSGYCAAHSASSTSLPSLTRQEPLAAVTYRPGQQVPEPLAWKQMLAAHGSTPGFTFVAGAAPDLAFGDLAAAFAPARWQLLEIEGRTAQARVAKAWRILSEHLPANDNRAAEQRCGVIFDAHRLDDATLELAQLLVRFPLAANIGIVFVGDAADPRPGWQQLLRSIEESTFPNFELCPDCDPRLLSGRRIDHQTALAG